MIVRDVGGLPCTFVSVTAAAAFSEARKLTERDARDEVYGHHRWETPALIFCHASFLAAYGRRSVSSTAGDRLSCASERRVIERGNWLGWWSCLRYRRDGERSVSGPGRRQGKSRGINVPTARPVSIAALWMTNRHACASASRKSPAAVLGAITGRRRPRAAFRPSFAPKNPATDRARSSRPRGTRMT